MANLAGFIEALGNIPAVTDPALVKRKSRDMTAAFSRGTVGKRESAPSWGVERRCKGLRAPYTCQLGNQLFCTLRNFGTASCQNLSLRAPPPLVEAPPNPQPPPVACWTACGNSSTRVPIPRAN